MNRSGQRSPLKSDKVIPRPNPMFEEKTPLSRDIFSNLLFLFSKS